MAPTLLRFCAVIAALALSSPAPAQQASGRSQPINPTAALFEAVLKNDMAGVRNSLAAGADIGARNEYGLTPADLAIKRGHYDIAHAILAVRRGPAAPQDDLVPRRRGPSPAPSASEQVAVPSPTRGNAPAGAAAPRPTAPASVDAAPRVPAVPRIPVERQTLAAIPPPMPELPPAPEPAKPATAEPSAPPPAKEERSSQGLAPAGFLSRVASLFGLVGKGESRVTADVPSTSSPSAPVAPPPPAAVPEAPPAPPPTPAVEGLPEAPALSRLPTSAGKSPPPPAVEAPPAPPAKTSSKSRTVEPNKADVAARAVRAPAPPKPPAPQKTVTELPPAAAPTPEPSAPAESPKVESPKVAASALQSEGPPLHLSRISTIGGPVFAPAGVPPSATILSAPVEPSVARPLPAPAPAPALPPAATAESPPSPPAVADVAPPAAEPEPTLFGRLRGFLGFGEKDLSAKEKAKGETQKAFPAGARAVDAPRAPRFTSLRPLQDVDLGDGLSLKLGQAMAAEAAPDHCLSKRGAKTWFCVEPVVWPTELQEILAAGTALYSGSKAIVRYDEGRAGHIHALFPSREFATIAAAFERRFGPPTDREDASMAIVGEPTKTNPVVRWKSLSSATNEVEIVELRTFDDLRGMIPDTEYGVIRYYRSDSQAAMVHLTTADLMLLRTRKTATE